MKVESVEREVLSAGAVAVEALAAGRKRKASAAAAGTSSFRGVRRRAGGKYGAYIQWRRTPRWLGSFGTAEDAARAYDAAAVKLHGARAVTNFEQPAAADAPLPPVTCEDKERATESTGEETDSDGDGGEGAACSRWRYVHDVLGMKQEAPATGNVNPKVEATRAELCGVRSRRHGKHRAYIYHRRAQVWHGSFDTAEEAARAHDAVAIQLRDARVVANFKHSVAVIANDDDDKDATESFGEEADSDGGEGAVCSRWRYVHEISLKQAPATRNENPKVEARRTEFCGVHRIPSGKYGAYIHDRRTQVWHGGFSTVDEAARAHNTAAVKLHGARAVTNFEQPASAIANDDATALHLRVSFEDKDSIELPGEEKDSVGDEGEVCPQRRCTWREIGMKQEQVKGKVNSKVQAGRRKKVASQDTWMATAYDVTAAVNLHGVAAKTNFEQPMDVAANDGDARLLHVTSKNCPSGSVSYDYSSEASLPALLNDFPGLPVVDFLSDNIIPEVQLDDLRINLPPVEFQQVDDFLNDMDFTDLVV